MKTKTKDYTDGVFSISNVTKSMVWDLQENDVIRLWQAAEKEQNIQENGSRYIDIVKTAFEIEELKIDKPEIIKKYEARGMRIATLPYGNATHKWAIKKRPIVRVTDLTYENIQHISAAKLLEVIDRNFGGGWESLSQSIRDIIESGFDISTTTLPKERLKKPGGIYEMKVNDGFEVLEIAKGAWVEAIFAKNKPLVERNTSASAFDKQYDELDEDLDDDDLPADTYGKDDEDDDLDDDELTAESYRTTIEQNPEDLDITVDDLDDEDY
ncbi:MAG: hypothetical protein U0K35_11110 [Prevotella sp.]|nr:hypothetical protein [Prevotella sp.]